MPSHVIHIEYADEVGAAAVDYLRVCGHLVFAYFWARMAKIALAKKDSGDPFYTAKLESRPVMISAPMDVQQMTFEDDDEPYKPSSTLIPPRAVRPDPVALKQAAGTAHAIEISGDGRSAATDGT